MDGMVEVDPDLFVTCRLCLEEKGVYQIVPLVAEQIRFCFDIDVQPFDCLPQLICKKCKSTLTEYYITKTTFVGKQNNLKIRFELNKEKKAEPCSPPQQGTVSSSQQTDHKNEENEIENEENEIENEENEIENEENEIENEDKEIENEEIFPINVKKRRAYCISSGTSSEEDRERPSSPTVKKKRHKRRRTKGPSAPWEAYYRKQYVCAVCKKCCKNKGNVTKHLRKHESLLTKYRDIIKTNCNVRLEKIDEKPNMTGALNTVVLSPSKIVANEGKMYYILYTPNEKVKNENNSSDRYDKNVNELFKEFAVSDVSGDINVKRIRKQRNRLLSKSSNDTVILEGENNKSPECSDNEGKRDVNQFKNAEINDDECINIDDSSDSASYKSGMDLRSDTGANNKFAPKMTDYRKIQNIISVCQTKYKKKLEYFENESSALNPTSQHKAKILNMGRKVINKLGFNCTGLLRFMEHNNLEIMWNPTNLSSSGSVNKENKFIRIMPRLRGKEISDSDNLGWKNIPYVPINEHEMQNLDSVGKEYLEDQIHYSIAKSVTPIVSSTRPVTEHPQENKTFLSVKPVDQAVLYCKTDTDSDASFKNKLLNASPVANPKQLPKKVIVAESKLNVPESKLNVPEVKLNVPELKLNMNSEQITLPNMPSIDQPNILRNEESNSDKNLCMPIITSTTSLAPYSSNEEKKAEQIYNTNKDAVSNGNITKDSDISTPRIKVKPVSELMSARVLKNLSQQPTTVSNNAWDVNPTTGGTLPYQITINNMHMTNIAPQSQGHDEPLKALQIVQIPITNVAHTEQVKPVQPTTQREYVLLDTVELPNTKTYSPFQYFKKLLQMHNLTLLDPNVVVPRDFVCLIKFKLQFKQETVEHPVVLYLSFLCSGNTFYLGIKHSGEENNIDINSFTAVWQWEILNKIYQNEVVNKILKNAQKLSPAIYEYTKTFLNLLKSIKCKSNT